MSYEPDTEPSQVNEPDMSGTYTAADYLTWKFEQMVELVQGKIFKMTAPVTNHQLLLMRLSSLLHTSLRNLPCQVWPCPIDVFFVHPGENYRQARNVYQPDLSIVCDSSKVKTFGIVGAPDFVIEILSPGTQKKDASQKFEIYEKYGVAEYWLISPAEKMVIINVLENGKYRTLSPKVEGLISPQQFTGVTVDLGELFEGLLE